MALSEKHIDYPVNQTVAGDQLFLANEKDLYIASRSLKAMGHPLRLKILCILAQGAETSVQDLVNLVGTSQSNISQHLSILRDKGILAARKDANKVYYRIGDEKILALMESMREAFCSDHE
ncbi:MAG TPA: transcriptional regulator [Gammaproteobacteria bacterium]|nr:transcriptional regulator [Gammaproteobacteria bacterium]|tara:strand:+ start:749 stop:1111 length:363 start_codon:yes stop_codon:yes gene_type:complete